MNRASRADVARATAWGLFTAGLVLAGIYFGSRRLRDFDVALVPWLAGIDYPLWALRDDASRP